MRFTEVIQRVMVLAQRIDEAVHEALKAIPEASPPAPGDNGPRLVCYYLSDLDKMDCTEQNQRAEELRAFLRSRPIAEVYMLMVIYYLGQDYGDVAGLLDTYSE